MTSLDLVLDTVARQAADLQIADALTGGDLERTIEGASTLTLELHDPHRKVIRHKALEHTVDFEFDGTWWRLVKVAKSGDAVVLTFEDRDVAYLRRHRGFRKIRRKTHTRAQFVRMLVREVERRPALRGDKKTVKYKIRFYCPEISDRQPVGTGEDDEPAVGLLRPIDTVGNFNAPTGRRDPRRRRAVQTDGLTVGGARATPEQKKNGQRVLAVANDLKAGPKATKALMEAVIVESRVKNLSGGDADSIGILQVRVGIHGRAVASSIEKSCTKFLQTGFTGKGGAIKLARENPSKTAGNIAADVQGPAAQYRSRYDQVAGEAAEWIDAYGGASGTDTGGVSDERPARRRYEFSRGKPGEPEDSWTCIQRLADEVNWRAFMDKGTLYFVSENRLRKAAARYVVTEDTDGVNTLDFDLDYGKVESELRMSCRSDLFDMRIGSVVVVRETGLANGRYLVSSVRRGLFDADTEVVLKRPTPKLPEPPAETVTPTGGTAAGGRKTAGAGSLRDRIVSVAQASAANYRKNPGRWHYLAGGINNFDDPTKPPRSRGMRSDCSQWVAAVYRKAGAPAPGPGHFDKNIFTGNMRVKGRAVPLSQARPGDIIWWPDHVELFVGPGNKTIGHGSTPVDPGNWNIKPGASCWRYSFLD